MHAVIQCADEGGDAGQRSVTLQLQSRELRAFGKQDSALLFDLLHGGVAGSATLFDRDQYFGQQCLGQCGRADTVIGRAVVDIGRHNIGDHGASGVVGIKFCLPELIIGFLRCRCQFAPQVGAPATGQRGGRRRG